jgi:hypothetical protein
MDNISAAGCGSRGERSRASGAAAKRLSEHRQQRVTDRDNLNRAIGLEEEPYDDLQKYHEMKVTEAYDALEAKKAELAAELDKAKEELRRAREMPDDPQPQTEVQQFVNAQAEYSRTQLLDEFVRQYPEANSQLAWQKLERENPNRAAQAKQYFANLDMIQRQHVSELAQRVPEHQAWRNGENQKFDAAHPELKDRYVRERIADAAVRVLQKAGASDQEIHQAWANPVR